MNLPGIGNSQGGMCHLEHEQTARSGAHRTSCRYVAHPPGHSSVSTYSARRSAWTRPRGHDHHRHLVRGRLDEGQVDFRNCCSAQNSGRCSVEPCPGYRERRRRGVGGADGRRVGRRAGHCRCRYRRRSRFPSLWAAAKYSAGFFSVRLAASATRGEWLPRVGITAESLLQLIMGVGLGV